MKTESQIYMKYSWVKGIMESSIRRNLFFISPLGKHTVILSYTPATSCAHDSNAIYNDTTGIIKVLLEYEINKQYFDNFVNLNIRKKRNIG